MNTLATDVAGRSALRPAILLLVTLAAGCAADDPVSGTWEQSEATATLPDVVGGGTLYIDAAVQMHAEVEPSTFMFDLDLEERDLMLSDALTVEGTYVDDGASLELTFTGFAIDPASGNESWVDEDTGAHCIVLQGFAGTPVCLPSPQTSAYSADGASLGVTLDSVVAGEPMQITFALSRVE